MNGQLRFFDGIENNSVLYQHLKTNLQLKLYGGILISFVGFEGLLFERQAGSSPQ